MPESYNDVTLIIPNPYTAEGINDTTHEQLLSILYLGTILKKNGFKCEIIDAKVLGLKNDQIIAQLQAKKPKIIGITLVSVSYKAVKDLCKRIRALEWNPKIILGGPHPTALPNETLKEFDSDAIVIGEGELTILEIATNLRAGKGLFKEVLGVAYKDNNNVIFNAPRPVNQNIDALPYPDHSMLPNPLLYKRRTKYTPAVPLLTSRGCPYMCTFCSRGVYKNKMTFRSPENVLGEIEYLVNHFGFRQIDMIDDNFLANKARAVEILQKIIDRKYNIAINLQNGIRVDTIDPEMLKLMKRAGVYRAALGVESGDENILKRVKKGINLESVKRAAKMTKEAGIRVDCFFMIGLPGDNATSMQKTIDFAKELKPNTANFSMTIPFPGTELYDEIKNSSSAKLFMDSRYGLDSGYNSATVAYTVEGMNEKEVLKYYKKAYRDFYLRPSQMIKMILDIKSYEEFKWLIETGFAVFRTILLKS
jgi:anaerobic magnesium-protoporphyrin IX monomethyl ester cyclase